MGLRLLRPFFQVFRCVTGLRRWLSFGFWRKGGQRSRIHTLLRLRGRSGSFRTQYAKDKIRILYFGDTKRRFVLLHGLVKRIEKPSGEDIQIADERMQKHNKKQERS